MPQSISKNIYVYVKKNQYKAKLLLLSLKIKLQMFVIRNVKIPKQTITQISNNRKMKINLILVSKSKFHAF